MATMDSPSAERNKEPIWKILGPYLSAQVQKKEGKDDVVRVLEIAAGCGVHTLHFCEQLDNRFANSIHTAGGANNGEKKKLLVWKPTDPDAPSRASINNRRNAFQGSSVEIHEAETLLLGQEEAPTVVGAPVDVIICINMIHISPWEATLGLMKLAGECLTEDGILYCYGPYKEGGTAVESNMRFDASLRSRDPSWGVRDLEEVAKVAAENGLNLHARVEMPANNLSVIYTKSTF
eukprot:CAMPEP_0196804852 /NCGR_PEP_ID=MMETSP1362-20130617/4527_1 /TAXON_ID=163516 /ORGANISM="Leptocylindrus danicus, Strain CCMP1856" /LENGTH=234 /DNA_ID=CAMNT_0042177389 /DNA_START=126 /DNA_END=830 /DNA_ORIENTATION=-